MLFNLYTVEDKAAKECSPLFCAVNDAVALRMYREILAKSSAPDDFELFRVGSWETVDMNIGMESEPVRVRMAIDANQSVDIGGKE